MPGPGVTGFGAGMEIISSVIEEGIASYSVSFLEVLQAIGVLGIIGFLFGWGLKHLKLLPTEARIYRQHVSVDSLSHDNL